MYLFKCDAVVLMKSAEILKGVMRCGILGIVNNEANLLTAPDDWRRSGRLLLCRVIPKKPALRLLLLLPCQEERFTSRWANQPILQTAVLKMRFNSSAALKFFQCDVEDWIAPALGKVEQLPDGFIATL